MTRCEQVERVLAAYSDGDLGGYVRQEVASHLECCADCRARLERYEASLAMITAGLRDTAPPNSEPVALPMDRRPRRMRPALALTAAAAVLGAAWLFATGTAPVQAPTDSLTQTPAPVTAIEDDPEIIALRARIAELEADVAALRTAHERTQVAAYEPLVDEREVVAAITLAAGAYYEKRPGGRADAAERYRYTAEAYGDTTSGQKARKRLQDMGMDSNALDGAEEIE